MVDSSAEVRRQRTASNPGGRFGFGLLLGLVTFLGMAVRIAAVAVTPDPSYLTDATYFRLQGLLLARGFGFADPFVFVNTHRVVATAFHPPLSSVFLGFVSWIGFKDVTAARIATCVLGSLTIVFIGLIGREVGGRSVGLLAAAIGAMTPNLWAPDRALASEGLAALMVAVAIWFAYQLRRDPRWRTAIGLGTSIALAGLTRPETLLLSVIVVIPLVVRLPVPRGRRWAVFAVVTAATIVVVGPWLVRSLTIFDRPVFLSSNGQAVIGYANCPLTYSGPSLGSWRPDCVTGTPQPASQRIPTIPDEAEVASEQGTKGLSFLESHAGEFISTVVWARIGRTWSVFRPFAIADAQANEGKTRSEAIVGVLFIWSSLLLGAAGVFALRRTRTAPVWPLLAPAVVVTAVSVLAYGTPRFRVVAEPSIAVLAALGICEVWRRWSLRSSSRSRRAET